MGLGARGHQPQVGVETPSGVVLNHGAERHVCVTLGNASPADVGAAARCCWAAKDNTPRPIGP